MAHVSMKNLPLWARRVPRYPIYWKGNPQLRVFLPQFWMKLVKSERDVPPSKVTFVVHNQMSRIDIKNYLEKIYNVSPIKVRVDVRQGDDIKNPVSGKVVGRHPDYKMAFVQLHKDETFEFPDIFKGKVTPHQKDADDYRETTEKLKERERDDWEKLSVPVWFR